MSSILETRILSGADDVEQRGSSMLLTSADLDIVDDGSVNQKIGLRFTDIDIPDGAVITSAYIQFWTKEADSGATSLQVRGLDTDDTAPFTTAANDLSSRPTTSAFASWQPLPWLIVGEAGINQRTPDLTAVVQEILGRSGWEAGNDLGFVITGTGTRAARSADSNLLKSPLLHIEYSLPGAVVVEKRITSGSDDVEQRGRSMYMGSSDLELVVDGSTSQRVGLRFTDMDIPAGAIITAAYIQFQSDERDSVATSLQIRGIDSDDAAAFTHTFDNLSSRPTTSAFAGWQPAAWTVVDEAGVNQRTPDLSAVVQEIVSRSGWQAGNDLAFAITGSGTRTASAFEDGAGKAPLLHVEYVMGSGGGSTTGDIVLAASLAFRENVAGAVAGTLSVAGAPVGQSYAFSVADNRFEVIGNQLRLKEDERLDFERTPTINLAITAIAPDGQRFSDTIAANVGNVPETRFAAFGDYGNNDGTPGVAQLVDNLNVDFIVTTGDNVYGSEPIDDQIGRYYSDYIGNYRGDYGSGSATNRFFPSLGNHDYDDSAGGSNASAYFSYFTLPGNERYYDFIKGPVHFFVLNSNSEEPDGRSSSSDQADWLRSELAASVSPYNIVYFHHAPYSSSDDHGSNTIMQWPFEEWGATAVLSGHDHTYERILRDDNDDGVVMPYFVTGLGGNTPYDFTTPVDGSAVRYSDDWGTMLIQASDETITFEFIAVDGGGQGAIIDSYTIERASLLSVDQAIMEQSTASVDMRLAGDAIDPATATDRDLDPSPDLSDWFEAVGFGADANNQAAWQLAYLKTMDAFM